MLSYSEFIDDSVEIPASFGEMCEKLSNLHETHHIARLKEGDVLLVHGKVVHPDCRYTGEEMAKMIEELEEYAV